jgi:hypothetical protein
LTAHALLATLRHRGIELTADSGRLHYRAPRGVLTADLLAAVAAQKGELLAVLREEQQQPFHRHADGRSPWPASLPELGARRIDAYAHCDACGRGTWVRYGATARCLGCALASRHGSPGNPIRQLEG